MSFRLGDPGISPRGTRSLEIVVSDAISPFFLYLSLTDGQSRCVDCDRSVPAEKSKVKSRLPVASATSGSHAASDRY